MGSHIRPAAIRNGLFLLLAVFLVCSGAIAQETGETDEQQESDLVIMQSGARFRGSIIDQFRGRITIRTQQPQSEFDIPLEDVYSLNGFRIDKLRAIRSYVTKISRQIVRRTDRPFTNRPSLSVSQEIPDSGKRNRSPVSGIFSALDAELHVLRLLDLQYAEVDDGWKKNVSPSLRLHPERAELVLQLTRRRPSGRPYDGSLSYRERFRVAHLSAHLWLRQSLLGRDGSPPSSNGGDVNTQLARYALIEGAANYLALASIFESNDHSIDEPVSVQSLTFSGVHVSKSVLSELPPLHLNRLTWAGYYGTRFAWSLIQAGGWEALKNVLRENGIDTNDLHPHLRSFLSGRATRHTLSPPASGNFQDRWNIHTSGGLGTQFLRWLITNVTDEKPNAPSWIDAFQSDHHQSFRSASGNQRLFGWVTQWETPDDASSFYKLLHNHLKQLPWSLTPGWNGENHRFISRNDLRVSIDRRENRVFCLIAPSASDHNLLFERLQASKGSSRRSPAPVDVSADELDRLLERWRTNQTPWTDLSHSRNRNALSFQRTGPAVLLEDPYLRVNTPSFWRSETGPFPRKGSLITMHPRDSKNVEIRINILRLTRTLNSRILSLIRMRRLEQSRFNLDVRRVPATSDRLDILEQKENLRVLDTFTFLENDPVGPEMHVREVVIGRGNQLITFRLRTPDKPDTLLNRRFETVIRTASYGKK